MYVGVTCITAVSFRFRKSFQGMVYPGVSIIPTLGILIAVSASTPWVLCMATAFTNDIVDIVLGLWLRYLVFAHRCSRDQSDRTVVDMVSSLVIVVFPGLGKLGVF